MIEIWCQVKSNNDYEISNLGRLRSLKSKFYGRIIRPYYHSKGYVCVNLWNCGKQEKWKLHRLVAIHFIDNPCNLPEVNHKDCNKHNNVDTNLEWVSSQDNVVHAKRHNRYSKSFKKIPNEIIRVATAE